MRVLLTGASGFIGSHLIYHLKNDKNYVTCLSRDTLSNEKKLYDFIKFQQSKMKNNYDVLIHLAAELDNTSQKLFSSNIKLTKKLLNICKKAKIKRFIFASSQMVYGKTKYLPINEKHKTKPITNYGKSKLLTEKLCNKTKNNFDIEITILRISSVFGYDQNKKFVIPKMFKDLISKKLIVHKFLNGFQLIDFIHVDDVCNAILKSCESKNTGTYNIASGTGITPYDLAKIISKFIDNCEIIIEDKNQYTNHSFYEITKAYNEIKFKPKIKLNEKILKPWFKLFLKNQSSLNFSRNLNNHNTK